MKNLQGSLMLLIAAILWGTTFVAQSEGMSYVEPFTYNAARMFIGGIVLIPVILIFNKFNGYNEKTAEKKKKIFKTSVTGGIFCGIVLFIASSLQQLGIMTTTAGKSGFITALYIVIVPFYEMIIFRSRISGKLWLCVLIAIIGFYLLCIKEGFSVSTGDLLTLGCAFFFAGHIVVIDYFTGKNTNGILMSCVQFFVSGILASVVMLLTEQPQIGSIMEAKYTILYAGLLSSGVAYTLQILGQKRTDPTVATLLMSLESVIAVISGALILGERLSLKEGTGCALVFMAVILAQLGSTAKKQDML